MDQVIPSLADLLAHFRPAFRAEAFHNFAAVVQAWLLCLGPRTLTEVWQFSVLQRVRHYSAIYHLFAHAGWQWDDLGRILMTLLLVHTVNPLPITDFASAGSVVLFRVFRVFRGSILRCEGGFLAT